jgi:hypothetical protein
MLLAPADKRTKRKRYKVFAAKLSDEKSEKGETYGTGPGISWRSGDKVSSGGRRATQAATHAQPLFQPPESTNELRGVPARGTVEPQMQTKTATCSAFATAV